MRCYWLSTYMSGRHTYSGVSLHFEDLDAFRDGCAAVVDDIDHGLLKMNVSRSPRVVLRTGW